MNTLILDNTVIFLASSLISFQYQGLTWGNIITVWITICLLAASLIFDNPWATLCISILGCALCFFMPTFCFYIPLFAYTIFLSKKQFATLIFLLPLLWYFKTIGWQNIVAILVVVILSLLFSHRSARLIELKKKLTVIRDDGQEVKLKLNMKNQELLERQDYEIHTATLKERNRIAREIHDNVGHMLSRSMLQIGALMAITKDEFEKEQLVEIKTTLDTAMTSIRESVHDLHDESIDMYTEINELITHFTFCPVDFDYNLSSELSRKEKYSLLAIIKEALSNISKHSNATHVSLTLIEHPGLYQLLIHDNGTDIDMDTSNGIGLKNIEERVAGIDGTLKITSNKGFRIFISLKKKRSDSK